MSAVDCQNASGVAQTPTSSLLRIPGEIRNQIYRYLLVSDRSVELHLLNGHPVINKLDEQFRNPFQPALLRTCHHIYSEGETILYGENDFDYRIGGRIPSYPRSKLFAESWLQYLEDVTPFGLGFKTMQRVRRLAIKVRFIENTRIFGTIDIVEDLLKIFVAMECSFQRLELNYIPYKDQLKNLGLCIGFLEFTSVTSAVKVEENISISFRCNKLDDGAYPTTPVKEALRMAAFCESVRCHAHDIAVRKSWIATDVSTEYP